ncbi:hypothetical protein CTI12_AA471240 [Artemisia annua]|uniref:ClpA/ClpB AAA lid domain-containing protein n=1 Tax=Artemisia annua TaxID=35608 RepID=A0A2U1LNM7_ARTAN|nr:hypothetical protein CTI12_AA471240 [Artemisia annua]
MNLDIIQFLLIANDVSLDAYIASDRREYKGKLQRIRFCLLYSMGPVDVSFAKDDAKIVIHTLIGAGVAKGAINAANILKPVLATGELHVPEPTVDETIHILKGLRERYEIHHKLRYTNDALVAVAQLSYQYISMQGTGKRFFACKTVSVYHVGPDGWTKLSGDDFGRLHHSYYPVEPAVVEQEMTEVVTV